MRPVEIVESCQLVFLQALAARVDPAAWALKGGGNLRFFYASERLSEDIDLDTFDVEPWAFQDRVDQTLGSDLLKRTLGVLGSRIEYVNPKERSETKSKWVLGVRHPTESEPVYTQIEVSHREYPYREFAKVEAVPQAALDRYAAAVRRPMVGHYLPRGAIAQKINALWGRDVRQPRDVFDLDILFRAAPDAMSKGDVDEASLRGAITRTFEIGYDEYRAKVLSFIEPDALPICEPVEAWEGMQVAVAGHLERLLP
jgi:hypothetical protein